MSKISPVPFTEKIQITNSNLRLLVLSNGHGEDVIAVRILKELQQQMVGGEKAQDKELKAKRMKRKKHMEKRMKYLSEALKNVDDEDGIMIKVYDDIHEELRAKSELAKKQKQKVVF